MNSQLVMLRGAEPRKILQAVVDGKVPAVMSYLSRDRWHIAKVQPAGLGANRFEVALWPREKPHPMNIQVGQHVGVSLKYEYGKFIFETTVVALEPPPGPVGGGVIALAVPAKIEIVQRRSYFRVNVPAALKVNVVLWPRGQGPDGPALAELSAVGPNQSAHKRYWQGRLADVSAGGAQVTVDKAYRPDFRTGQFLGIRFTPMPYETPLMFNAQVRNILPTAEGGDICIGLQIVGLEASPQGRCVLQRLCGVVERYYQINQSGAKQQDMRGWPLARRAVEM